MRRIERLKSEARQSSANAGHKLGRFYHVNRYSEVHNPARPIFRATCEVCGAYVQVLPNPYPNEIDISGDVFGRVCNTKKGA